MVPSGVYICAMNTSLVSDRHPVFSMLLIMIMVGVGFLLIGPGVGLAVASLFFEGNLLTALQANPDVTLFTPLMITQGFAGLLGLIVIPSLYIVFFEQKSLQPFFRFDEPWIVILAVIMAAGISFQVALSPVIEWNMNFQFPEFMESFGEWAREREDALMGLTKVLTNFTTPGNLLLGFIVIAVLPGIGEELVFRGLIQNEFKRGTGNVHLAIWVSAFLFSAIHMQFFGFVPRMMLGALFGYLYHWSGNLLIPMFAHFFHNGFTLLMLYLFQIGYIEMNPESSDAAPLPWAIFGIISTFALLYYFRKLYHVRKQIIL